MSISGCFHPAAPPSVSVRSQFLSFLAISAEERTSCEWQHSRCGTIKRIIILHSDSWLRAAQIWEVVRAPAAFSPTNTGITGGIRHVRALALVYVLLNTRLHLLWCCCLVFSSPSVAGEATGYRVMTVACVISLSCRGRWNRRDGQSDGGPAVRSSIPRSQETDTAKR